MTAGSDRELAGRILADDLAEVRELVGRAAAQMTTDLEAMLAADIDQGRRERTRAASVQLAPAEARYVGSWSPKVALAVAEWLASVAASKSADYYEWHHARTVARAYLSED